jgi:hypothetical protein
MRKITTQQIISIKLYQKLIIIHPRRRIIHQIQIAHRQQQQQQP